MDNRQAAPRIVETWIHQERNETAHVVKFRNLLGQVRTELIGLHLIGQPFNVWAELSRVGAKLYAHTQEACCLPLVEASLEQPALSGVTQHMRAYLAFETCQLDCALESGLDRFHELTVCRPESNFGECGSGLEEDGGHGW